MIVQEAISLIQNEYIKSNSKIFWADLGCGSGLFTHALASLLNEESIVYAIDKNISTFKKNISIKGAAIKLTEADFEKDNLPLTGLNGIMMANSLHFCKRQKKFS